MTDNNENATSAVTDQPKPAPIVVTFSTPDVWTVGHWATFSAARNVYIKDAGDSTSNLLADWHGARALIGAGVVHVKGLDIPNDNNAPLWMVGLLVREISNKIQEAVSTPPDFLKLS